MLAEYSQFQSTNASYDIWQALSQSVCSMFFFVFSFFFRLNKTLLSRTFHDFTGQYNGILYSKLFNQEMVWSVNKELAWCYYL